MSKKCNHDWSFDGESSNHKMGFFTCNLCGEKYTSEGIPDSFYQPDSIIDQLKIEIHRHGQTTTSLVCYEAMQKINSDDKRIQQLLALVEKKNEGLIKACELIEKFSLQVHNGSDCLRIYNAVELQPSGVELVEVGEADFDKPAGTVNLDIYNIDFDGMHKLYTIKTKE